MKSLLRLSMLSAALLVLTAFAFAQSADSINSVHWKFQLENSLGATQSAYSDNWVGGEAGSLIWVADHHSRAERTYASYWYWGNELKLSFGQSHTQVDSTKKWEKPRKSSDKLRYDGIVRYSHGWLVDPYVGVTFESQFLDASNPKKKRYVNPIETTEATGVARTIINHADKTVLSTRVGFGLRQRFTTFSVPDTAGAEITYHETTNDGGFEWVTDLLIGSAKTRYSFNSKLSLFQSVFHDKSGGVPTTVKENDDWKAADVNWDNVLRANLTSVLQVALAWQLLYDKQVAVGGRFRETLFLGLAYKFANYTSK